MDQISKRFVRYHDDLFEDLTVKHVHDNLIRRPIYVLSPLDLMRLKLMNRILNVNVNEISISNAIVMMDQRDFGYELDSSRNATKCVYRQ